MKSGLITAGKLHKQGETLVFPCGSLERLALVGLDSIAAPFSQIRNLA